MEPGNCYEWHELDRDLLELIPAKCDDATTLARFAMVCTSWRDASSRTDALWRPLLEARFPQILSVLPEPASFKRFYRDQVAAEHPPPAIKVLAPTCQLSDFVFTFELIRETREEKRKILESWTGQLEADLPLDRTFFVPLKWTEWWRSMHGAYCGSTTARSMHIRETPPVLLEMFVSRCVNGQPRTLPCFRSKPFPLFDNDIEAPCLNVASMPPFCTKGRTSASSNRMTTW